MGRVRVLEIAGQLSAAIDVLNVVSVNHLWFAPARGREGEGADDLHAGTRRWNCPAHPRARSERRRWRLRMVVLYLLSREGNVRGCPAEVPPPLDALDRTEPEKRVAVHGVREGRRVARGGPQPPRGVRAVSRAARRIEDEDVDADRDGVPAAARRRVQRRRGGVSSRGFASTSATGPSTISRLSTAPFTASCWITSSRTRRSSSSFSKTSPRSVPSSWCFSSRFERPRQTLRRRMERSPTSRRSSDAHVTATRGTTIRSITLRTWTRILLQCAELFLSRESGEPRGANDTMTPGVQRATAILEIVCRRARLIPAQVLLMRARFVAGALDAAAQDRERVVTSRRRLRGRASRAFADSTRQGESSRGARVAGQRGGEQFRRSRISRVCRHLRAV